MAEHILLVGMMGAGKSTVARLVAGRLGRPHLDTDAEVQRAAGLSVREIFAERGELAFRAEESRVLDAVLGHTEPAVISVGGGAILDPAHRVALRDSGTVVWLRARPETLARRVGRNADRPLLAAHAGGPAAALTEIEAQRRALYEEVATVVIDVDDLSPRAVAERVVGSIGAPSTDVSASTDVSPSTEGSASRDTGRPTGASKQQPTGASKQQQSEDSR